MRCPQCHYPGLQGAGKCPKCGTAFVQASPAGVPSRPEPKSVPGRPGYPRPILLPPIQAASESKAPQAIRGLGLLFLALWGLPFFLDPLRPSGLACALFQFLNTPFALVGQQVFPHFGSGLLTLLGHPLGEVLVPCVALAWLLAQGRALGASAAGWWLGVSLMDGAFFLEHLREHMRDLQENGCQIVDFQSWDFHMIAHGHSLARATWTLGALIMIAALGLGGRLLWRQGEWGEG